MIDKLIQIDSIPNEKYKTRNNFEKFWTNAVIYDLISIETYNEIFENSYLINGKIDNCKILKDSTGNEGLIFISNIKYSEGMNKAIVGVHFQCGWSCGQSQVRYYEKQDSNWYLNMIYTTSES